MFALPTSDLKHIWDKAGACLPELKDASIFITGATGFFGQWILEAVSFANHFLNANISVLALTRNKTSFYQRCPQFKEAAWLHFIEGDVRDFVFPNKTITHVIHAATDASAALNLEHPQLMLDTAFLGTRRVLAFAKEAKAKSFLLTSSGAVYGRQPVDVSHVHESFTDDNNALAMNSAYGMGKLAAEYLALLYAKEYDLPVKIARCFAFVGPLLPLDTHFAIGNFMANSLAQTPISIAGDGSPLRSYLYAADLVIWLLTILCKGESARTYNVGSQEAITIAELAHLIAQTATPPLTVEIAKTKNPHVASERYVPSTQRAQTELLLQQWIDLPNAIQRTLLWNQTHAKTKSLCS